MTRSEPYFILHHVPLADWFASCYRADGKHISDTIAGLTEQQAAEEAHKLRCTVRKVHSTHPCPFVCHNADEVVP